MEFWRMAFRLASESSVVTTDCNTELKSEHKRSLQVDSFTVLWPFTDLENKFSLLHPSTHSVLLWKNILMV